MMEKKVSIKEKIYFIKNTVIFFKMSNTEGWTWQIREKLKECSSESFQ